jgi:hypothetical protein
MCNKEIGGSCAFAVCAETCNWKQQQKTLNYSSKKCFSVCFSANAKNFFNMLCMIRGTMQCSWLLFAFDPVVLKQ